MTQRQPNQKRKPEPADAQVLFWSWELRGWLAADEGKDITENPLKPGTDEWLLWRRGWFKANNGLPASIW